MKKEHASVALVFGGFVVLVLTVRGTFGNAFHALFGAKPAGGATTSTSAAAPRAAAVRLLPGSFNLEYPTAPGSPNLPGSAPRPAARRGPSYVPHNIQIGNRTVYGQLTEGERGETEYFSSGDQIAALGGGTFVRAGRYTRVKEPPTVPGGGPNTIWEYTGS